MSYRAQTAPAGSLNPRHLGHSARSTQPRGLRRTSPAASVLNSIAEPHAIPREAKMTGRSESIFSWLSVLGAAVPPRDPNDDEEDEEDGGDEDDDREPAVIREPDED